MSERVDINLTSDEVVDVLCEDCKIKVKALLYDKTREAVEKKKKERAKS